MTKPNERYGIYNCFTSEKNPRSRSTCAGNIRVSRDNRLVEGSEIHNYLEIFFLFVYFLKILNFLISSPCAPSTVLGSALAHFITWRKRA